MMRNPTTRHQRGYVLITALIFLLILSLAAITAMRNTTLELQMSANAAFKTRALNASEGVRLISGDLIDAHVYSGGWPVSAGGSVPDGVFGEPIPSGLSILDNDTPADGVPDNLWEGNDTGESLLTHTSLNVDINYGFDGGGDGSATLDDELDVVGNVRVFRGATKAAPGAGFEQIAGYSSLGVGAGGGGSYTYFELRATGQAPSNAEAVTASDFRYLIR